MTDDDYDEYEYEYEYSDNDDEDESDNDNMMCESSRQCEDAAMSPVDENANPNAPPSPRRVRKSPSWQTDRGNENSPRHLLLHDSSGRNQNNKKVSWTTSVQGLLPLMGRSISDITEALGIPTEAAAPLLRQHKWNTQRVLEAFMSDSERALAKAGVTHRCSPKLSAVNNNNSSTECSICMDDMSASESLAMPCGHAFCLDCWQDFLTNAIQHEGATCMDVTCPEATCGEIITETEVKKAAPELVARYQHYQIASFVEDNGRWCPGKGCDRVALPCGHLEADCDKCGTCFCTGCSEEPHSPVKCDDLKQWAEKGADESETVNWLTVNTKNCPKCSSRIEKNGGCMYVTCRKCSHGFCWQCLGDHHVWQCNAYKEPEDDGKLRAKNELERYLHYYTRFSGHADAQKFALKQLNKKVIKQKESEDKDEKKTAAEAKEQSSDSNNNKSSKATDDDFCDLPDYLKDANQQLVHCRRVLKYTYVFAYYHFVDPSLKGAKECFEFHQGTLEGLTEGLSKATEKPLEDIDQQDVVNRTRAIGEFIKNVLAHVDDGMDDGY